MDSLTQIVLGADDGYLEGERSLSADHGPIRFREHRVDADAQAIALDTLAGQRLHWFSRCFIKVERIDDRLVISDLRMGSEPAYVFRFVIARKLPSGDWVEIAPEQSRIDWSAQRRLASLWSRIWRMPDASGGTEYRTPDDNASLPKP